MAIFGSSKEEGSKRIDSFQINSLSEQSVYVGSLETNHDFRIDGKFEGNIKSNARVIIGLGGEVNGEINCESAIIQGKFSGKLIAKDLLEVFEKAVIVGEISIGRLVVHEGGIFNVKCEMNSLSS